MVDPLVLQEATRRLAAMFDPERIILFGSQARGTADVRSDVDLLVICRVKGSRRELALAMDRTLRGLRLEQFTNACDPKSRGLQPARCIGKRKRDTRNR